MAGKQRWTRWDEITIPERTEVEYAWLAGLVDGEGCLAAYEQGGAKLLIGMCHEATVRHIADYYFEGKCRVETRVPDKPNRRPSWQLRVESSVLRLILPRIKPYMITKKAEAEVMEELLALIPKGSGGHGTMTPEKKAERTRLIKELKTLKGRISHDRQDQIAST